MRPVLGAGGACYCRQLSQSIRSAHDEGVREGQGEGVASGVSCGGIKIRSHRSACWRDRPDSTIPGAAV